jgi:hypothetical protein
MLHEKAVKKVEKALGVKMEKTGSRWACVYDGYVLSWIASPGWKAEGDTLVEDGVLEASNWHIRKEDDHSDSMTDYYAGSFMDNVTQLINYVKPPAPKFELGALVKGKDNKRANRQGYANKLGVVTRNGRYMGVEWVDSGLKNYASWASYPQNDFILAQ